MMHLISTEDNKNKYWLFVSLEFPINHPNTLWSWDNMVALADGNLKALLGDCLIITMRIPILVIRHHYIEMPIKLRPSYNDIKNNAWVTVNNDFWSRVRWFANDFHEGLPVKIIGKSPHEWPKKSLFTVTNVLFYFLHAILCLEHTDFATNNHRSPISPLSPRMVFSDLTLWRHHNWVVTSRECESMALWRHIHWLFSHAQIGAKAIFTSE